MGHAQFALNDLPKVIKCNWPWYTASSTLVATIGNLKQTFGQTLIKFLTILLYPLLIFLFLSPTVEGTPPEGVSVLQATLFTLNFYTISFNFRQ